MSRKKLVAGTIETARLSAEDRRRMLEILVKYYDAITEDQFARDLSEKYGVIVLRDRESGVIQGFSTLLRRELILGGRRVLCVFSGDTVVEREYWGQKTLGQAFLVHLWSLKARSPFRPLYWFLISKGYKTYLLMANNFPVHFPRYERETPAAMRELMDRFYALQFPTNYDAISGRVIFERCPGRLKEGVAEIEPALLESNERVRFFQACNPGWPAGDELACVAEMTFLMPLQYKLKWLQERLFGRAKQFERVVGAPSLRPRQHFAARVERRDRAPGLVLIRGGAPDQSSKGKSS